MTSETTTPGHLMARESAECLSVFAHAAAQEIAGALPALPRSVYTVARGCRCRRQYLVLRVYARTGSARHISAAFGLLH